MKLKSALFQMVCLISSIFLLSACAKRSLIRTGNAKAAIATDDQQASDAAREIFEQGGNIADAAVAASLAIATVNPQTNTIAGGGFLVFHQASEKKTTAWDFREVAPLRATTDMFLKNGEVIPNASMYGAKAVAVPGLIAGLFEFHRAHGVLPWKKVVAPSIRLAKVSKVSKNFARHIRENMSGLQSDAYLKEKFLPNGVPLSEGAKLEQPDLARTLEGIAKGGRDYFYKGEFAQKLNAWMQSSGGLIGLDDMNAYRPKKRKPIEANWRGYKIFSMPPPSSGGIHLVQILKIIDAVPDSYRQTFSSKKTANRVVKIEAYKRAFADRSVHLGDPARHWTPIDQLLDETYLKLRADEISKGISPSSDIRPLTLRDKNTTHLSFIDHSGNAISLTQTSNGWFGARVVVPGTGVLLNNEMDDFVVKPGVKNIWGLVGGQANQIEPQKRPLSSMSPTIVLDQNGRVRMVVGSRGGARIITSTANMIHRVLADGEDITRVMPECRFHHQWSPDEVLVEKNCVKDFSDLQRLYTVKEGPIFGEVEVVGRNENGNLFSAPDSRSTSRPILVY